MTDNRKISQNGFSGDVEFPQQFRKNNFLGSPKSLRDFGWSFGRKFRTSSGNHAFRPQVLPKNCFCSMSGDRLFGLRFPLKGLVCSMSGNAEPIATTGFASLSGRGLRKMPVMFHAVKIVFVKSLEVFAIWGKAACTRCINTGSLEIFYIYEAKRVSSGEPEAKKPVPGEDGIFGRSFRWIPAGEVNGPGKPVLRNTAEENAWFTKLVAEKMFLL